MVKISIKKEEKTVVWGWSVNDKKARIRDVGVSKSVGWPR